MLGRRSSKSRADDALIADRASEAALAALREDNVKKARDELGAVPKRIDFAEVGWKVSLVMALTEFSSGRRRQGLNLLEKVFERLDETSLSKDDKGYLRLFALYRAIENTKDGRAPGSLRAHAENFRFDTTLVNNRLKEIFPLKKVEPKAEEPSPPPFPAGMGEI